MARYIYYQKVYRLHIGYFNGNGLLEKERLEQELKDIARYFADNAGFYSYYRMGCIHHDELYFIRGAHDWKICPEINHFDAVFSTSCDGKLAELMARELLLKYIDGMLNPSVKLIEPVAVTVSSPAMKLYPMPPYPMRLFAQCRYAYVEASIPALRHTLLAKALCAGAAAGRLRRCGCGHWLVEVLLFVNQLILHYEQYHQPHAGFHTEVFQNTSQHRCGDGSSKRGGVCIACSVANDRYRYGRLPGCGR
jgi:hypothetical protein